MSAPLTPSQTVGPFFHDGLLRGSWSVVAGDVIRATRIRIEGTVLDGGGAPVADAMVEIWQANGDGRYNHPADDRSDTALDPGFVGFGRSATDDDGRYWFETVKPGRPPWPDGGWQAPHVNVLVFARGLLDHLATRLYFDDDPANGSDPVLALVGDRSPTLIARRAAEAPLPTYVFDIVLQGPRETVWLTPR